MVEKDTLTVLISSQHKGTMRGKVQCHDLATHLARPYGPRKSSGMNRTDTISGSSSQWYRMYVPHLMPGFFSLRGYNCQ